MAVDDAEIGNASAEGCGGEIPTRVEILVPEVKWSSKARRFIAAVRNECPLHCELQHHQQHDDSFVICYGAQTIKRRHSRHWAYLDLGYWGREKRTDFPIRLSFNARHPQAFLNEDYPPRWHPPLKDFYEPNGRVIVVGQGQKSCRNIYEDRWQDWDRATMAEATRRFPDREVVYRPKPRRPGIAGFAADMSYTIPEVLDGASLVITRHSNVGVDAIIHGIPVATDDGAARAVYRGGWDATPISDEKRRRFLNALAWYNWKPSEAHEFWKFVLSRFRMLYKMD